MNILLVLTGGTIGSLDNGTSIDTDEKSSLDLLSTFRKNHTSQNIKFTIIQAFSILSENMTPKHWSILTQSIQDENLDLYDGIIITHGTDTLAFTANALAVSLGHVSIPIVLVSAHLPPSHPQSNAHTNFYAATLLIKESPQGVYICYKNPDESFTSVFSAQQLSQSLQLSSVFISISPLKAKVLNDTFTWLHKNTSVPTKKCSSHFSEEILYIKPFPGMQYEHYNLNKVDYILHDLYHSGTCDEKSLSFFLKTCKQKEILVLLAPISSASSYYESTQSLINQDAVFIFNQSIEETMVRFMYATANLKTKKDIINFVKNTKEEN